MFFNWLLSEAAGFPLVDGKALDYSRLLRASQAEPANRN